MTTTTTEATITTTEAFTFSATTTADEVTGAYRAADVSGKAILKKAHREAIHAAAMAGDGDLAVALVKLGDAMTSATKSTTPTPVDYVTKVRDLRATLLAAVRVLDEGYASLPEGTTVDWSEVDLAGGHVDGATVADLTTVTGRKVKRGNVATWVASVVTEEPRTIAQLRSAWVATEDYPKSAPSAGAIGACLARGNGEGYEVTEVKGTVAAVAAV